MEGKRTDENGRVKSSTIIYLKKWGGEKPHTFQVLELTSENRISIPSNFTSYPHYISSFSTISAIANDIPSCFTFLDLPKSAKFYCGRRRYLCCLVRSLSIIGAA